MINNNRQYLKDSQVLEKQSGAGKKALAIAGLVGSLLPGLSQADESSIYKGSWSAYGISGSEGSGMGTQAIMTDTKHDISIGYRGDKLHDTNNQTLVGAFRVGDNYMIVPTHAKTIVKTEKGVVNEQNSHIEGHAIYPGYWIDHVTVSLGTGKTYGNNEFQGEKWKGFGVSAGGNLDIGNHPGYLYASWGQEYIKNGERNPYISTEYHSGNFRASIFAMQNGIREYKAEYGNGTGIVVGLSHTEAPLDSQKTIENTRLWVGWIFTWGGHENHKNSHTLDSHNIARQTLFSTEITNNGTITETKGEFQENNKKHHHTE